MKKIFSKKWLVILSSSVLASIGIAIACADSGDWEDYVNYYSSVKTEKYVDSSSIPFFYGANEFIYGTDLNNNIGRFTDQNTNDWYEYLGGALPLQTVDRLLHNDSAQALRSALFANLGNKNYQQNGISLRNGKVRDFIYFLRVAKPIEAFSTRELYSWYYDDNKDYEKVGQDITEQTLSAYEKYKGDAFVKNRLWFQVMKAHFYSYEKKNAIYFFDKTAAAQPVNTLYYRALSYVAGAYYQLKDYETSNYLFSKVYLDEPALRHLAVYNFHPQAEKDFYGSLKMAKNNAEKIALWTMLGLYGDELRAIKEIYALQPDHRNLEFLAATYLVGLEQRFNSKNATDIASFRQELKEIIAKDEWAIIDKIAREEKTTTPALWYNITGYMNMLNGDYKLAARQYQQSLEHTDKSAAFADQNRILQFINKLLSLTDISSQVESGLYEDLKWVYEQVDKENIWDNESSPNRYYHAKQFARTYLYKLYLKTGQPEMAQLVAPSQSYYFEKQAQDNMLRLMNRKNNSNWVQLLIKDYTYTKGDIYYLQGLVAAWNNNIPEAVTLMKQAARNNVVTILDANPFNGKIKDCNDCDYEETQHTAYNSVTYLEKIQEMQAYLKQGKDVYNNATLLGNAFYSMSYFGNTRNYTINNPVIIASHSYIDKHYKDLWMSMSHARHYYETALKQAETDEQKARIHYLLSKVERNEYYVRTFLKDKEYFSGFDYYYRDDKSIPDFVAGTHFEALKQYKHTRYYQDVIRECGYFRKYITKNR